MKPEVLVADLGKAIKSALIFAGSDDLFQAYDYVRIEAHAGQLYLISGDKYQVAVVRIEEANFVTTPSLYVSTASLKAAAANFLKPGRTKPTVQLRAGDDGIQLVRQDDLTNPYQLETYTDPSPLPPAFSEPYAPIDWEWAGYSMSPFAVGPELITKLARAAWAPTDAAIVEAGGLPHKPITIRLGSYLVAVLAPKDGRNGNTTTTAPNSIETRRSWHEALTAMKLTH